MPRCGEAPGCSVMSSQDALRSCTITQLGEATGCWLLKFSERSPALPCSPFMRNGCILDPSIRSVSSSGVVWWFPREAGRAPAICSPPNPARERFPLNDEAIPAPAGGSACASTYPIPRRPARRIQAVRQGRARRSAQGGLIHAHGPRISRGEWIPLFREKASGAPPSVEKAAHRHLARTRASAEPLISTRSSAERSRRARARFDPNIRFRGSVKGDQVHGSVREEGGSRRDAPAHHR